ncbi:hypothetical protein [Streptosporangium roseum]
MVSTTSVGAKGMTVRLDSVQANALLAASSGGRESAASSVF